MPSRKAKPGWGAVIVTYFLALIYHDHFIAQCYEFGSLDTTCEPTLQAISYAQDRM